MVQELLKNLLKVFSDFSLSKSGRNGGWDAFTFLYKVLYWIFLTKMNPEFWISRLFCTLFWNSQFSSETAKTTNNKKILGFGGKVSLAYPQTSKKFLLLSISKQQKTDMKGLIKKVTLKVWGVASFLSQEAFLFCRFSLEGIAKRQQPFLSAFPHAPELGQCLSTL